MHFFSSVESVMHTKTRWNLLPAELGIYWFRSLHAVLVWQYDRMPNAKERARKRDSFLVCRFILMWRFETEIAFQSQHTSPSGVNLFVSPWLFNYSVWSHFTQRPLAAHWQTILKWLEKHFFFRETKSCVLQYFITGFTYLHLVFFGMDRSSNIWMFFTFQTNANLTANIT